LFSRGEASGAGDRRRRMSRKRPLAVRAARNAARGHGFDVRLSCGADWLESLGPDPFDVIVSNPALCRGGAIPTWNEEEPGPSSPGSRWSAGSRRPRLHTGDRRGAPATVFDLAPACSWNTAYEFKASAASSCCAISAYAGVTDFPEPSPACRGYAAATSARLTRIRVSGTIPD